MPVARKGARLWLRPERRATDGKIRRAMWIIIDGGRHIATGCAAGETDGAERALAEHIAKKHQPARRERDIERIAVSDVLSIYVDDRAPDRADDARELDQRVLRLNDFLGGDPLANITGQRCRAYVSWRGNRGGARRDLEVLRAAINHHAEQGFHRALVKVELPERGAPRDRWLTRSEAARLLWACWRKREEQTVHRGGRRGEKILTDRRPLRHLARFILIGLYTGTRASAIAAAAPSRGAGRSFVDLDAGIFHRLPEGHRVTKKRQPPAPIPPRLLAHMRRWARLDATEARGRAPDGAAAPQHFVEWNGKAVTSVKTSFAAAVRLAKLEGKVSPHTLRHTAATWLMQIGVDKWEAAGFLGMSVQMLDRVYGHHHPDHLKQAATRIGYRHQSGQPLVHSLVERQEELRKRA